MTTYHCDDCDFETDDEDEIESLIHVHHLGERLDAGGIVPDGVCPDCGAFVYSKESDPSKQLTPDNCGASQLACNIVNNTFLALDGFEAMRKQMARTEYKAEHFGAELARIVDREIRELVEPLQEAVDNYLDCNCSQTGCEGTCTHAKAKQALANATDFRVELPRTPKGWESVEA